MSVMSSPLEITNVLGIETMQEMTSAVCVYDPAPRKTVDVPSAQLKDARDGKYYWVSKLADGSVG